MSFVGVVLKEGYLDDNRKIYYLHEDIRRYIQNKGFEIEAIIPHKNNINNISNIVIQDDLDYDFINNDVNTIRISSIDNLSMYDDLFNNINDNNSLDHRKLGITCRYIELNEIGPVIYIAETIIKNFNCDFRLIIPVQDITYPITSSKDFPPFSDLEKILINKQIDSVNGLLFPGGYKFTPFDRYILDYAVYKDIPTLGVCLGMQLISCFNKEVSLLPIESSINHKQDNDLDFTHSVTIDKDSILYDIIGTDKIKVNSFHKMMATPNPNVKVIAYSEDGIIEGVVIPNKKFILGVQWHPEISYNIDVNSKKIIDYFIKLL